MLNKGLPEQQLAQLPLYVYEFIDPAELEFSDRVRWICEHECPMYGKSWACPPGVGSVEECRGKCARYANCLMISTITEVADISDLNETLNTRPAHEKLTVCREKCTPVWKATASTFWACWTAVDWHFSTVKMWSPGSLCCSITIDSRKCPFTEDTSFSQSDI